MSSFPIYSATSTEDSDSSWYGLSEASTQTEVADECHETNTILTRGGRFSILSLRKRGSKQDQKICSNFDRKIHETSSFEEEIEVCTDTDTTEEEEEKEEGDDEEGEIELEIIRVKRIKGRTKIKKTLTCFSKNKKIITLSTPIVCGYY